MAMENWLRRRGERKVLQMAKSGEEEGEEEEGEDGRRDLDVGVVLRGKRRTAHRSLSFLLGKAARVLRQASIIPRCPVLYSQARAAGGEGEAIR